MKDIVHHLKHLQKKVIASSRKTVVENNSYEGKLPLNQVKNSPNQVKKELRS